ncbi:MAG: metallophosphoesterase [Nanoarchaeota archaeon]|nr:metallophosphoesterase [Nanoarchaeota archaeon]
MSSKILTILALPDLHGKKPSLVLKHKPEFDIIITPGDICLDNLRGNTNNIKNIKQATKESIKKGEEILQKLSEFNKPIYLVPGNWEPTEYTDGIKREDSNLFEKMISKFPLIYNCEYQRIDVKDTNISIIGAGSTSAPEILSRTDLLARLKYEEDEEEIEELQQRYLYQTRKFELVDETFEELYKKKYSKNFTILLSHNSPYNTPLDIIKNPFSPLHNQHYGSVLSRLIIEKYQPELVISGHIHEGVGICKIKNSICLNTGFGSSIYHIIKIDLEKNKVLSIKKFGKNLV